ncbi:hypothetical protein B0H19DRAFT_1310902 [Mycena capillaripes]|nr:hypothetical protein B0H19DRAFT_1310902 [Mycena capillaripes]
MAPIPNDYPVPGKTTVYDTTETIDLENVHLNGGVLIKALVLSIDPYMRGRLRAPGIEFYMAGGGLGVVLRSEVAGVESGTHVRGMLGSSLIHTLNHQCSLLTLRMLAHQEDMIAQNLEMLEVIERDPRLDWSVYIGVAGMPASFPLSRIIRTAFMGWREYSQAKKGEVAFVSTGAGSVGSMIIQIAKQDGLKVIASAGSDEKVKFMKEIGADIAFNYKTMDVRQVLAKEGPIDIYWDNV